MQDKDVKCQFCLANDDSRFESCQRCRHLRSWQTDEWAPWLARFLEHAGHVQTLFLRVTVFVVPLSTTIKHLMLVVREDVALLGCQYLQQLQVLETLCIQWAGGVSLNNVNEDELSEGYSFCRSAADLDLRMCRVLAAVRFAMVVPISFKAPEHCRVTIECDSHVFCNELLQQDSRMWRLLEDGCDTWYLLEMLSGTEVYEDDWTELYEDYCQDLAAMLCSDAPVTQITSLCLDLHWLGSFKVGQCLKNLKDLEIRQYNKNVEIDFVPGIRLVQFVVVALTARLTVPDLVDFAGSIRKLYFDFDFYNRYRCHVIDALLGQHLAIKPILDPARHYFMKARFPADLMYKRRIDCHCGACHTCLGLPELFAEFK